MYLTSEDVQDILHLLDTLPFAELHLRTGSFILSLRRGARGDWTQTAQVLSSPDVVAPVPGALPVPGAPPALATAAGAAPPAPGQARDQAQGQTVYPGQAARLGAVVAPLPGTFYRAPKPGAPPFVEVGGNVDADTVVGIIETMKLMNSVSAGIRGTVADICLADAEFAGQDAVLMWIDPEVR